MQSLEAMPTALIFEMKASTLMAEVIIAAAASGPTCRAASPR